LRVESVEFRVQDLGFGVWGLGFGVWGYGGVHVETSRIAGKLIEN